MTVLTITTPGSGSITVGGGGANDPPSGVTSITIECWGSGGSPLGSTGQEAGGASGAYARTNDYPVTDGTVLNYTVGSGQKPDGTQTTSLSDSVFVAGPVTVCLAKRASRGSAGTAAESTGDVTFDGANGRAAQGGGGSRGGSGGSSSAGPSGAGVQGTAGSGSSGGAGAAGGTDVGGGGNGGNSGANGADGTQPGGGAGGGGSSGGNAGTGGAGQVRFTWTEASGLHTLMLMGAGPQ